LLLRSFETATPKYKHIFGALDWWLFLAHWCGFTVYWGIVVPSKNAVACPLEPTRAAGTNRAAYADNAVESSPHEFASRLFRYRAKRLGHIIFTA
jgi:hypothetical protein